VTTGQTGGYVIHTFGCQMNEHDSERIAGLLEASGIGPAADPERADVVVLNTCCIRETADTRLYGTLGHLKSWKERHPGAAIMVGGCLAQKDGEELLRRAPHVDVVFGTHNVGRAVELLEQARERGPVVEIIGSVDEPEGPTGQLVTDLPARRLDSYAAWVTIQVGCDNSCAFCIVPAVRGPEISRPMDELLAEVRALAADGVIEVTLLGQNVNSYGRDLALAQRRRDGAGRVAPQFAALLRAVGAIEGIERVRFTSPHPKDLRPETIAAMAEVDAVCEHLHLPLQSGSDRILAAMRRGYTASRYLERLGAARGAIDDLAVTTDVIVGFPGETDADFEATLEVVAEAEFDAAFTFIYSPRPGTEAAGWADRFVPHETAVARMERLRAVLERSSRRRNEARVGRVEEVIIEGPSKRDASRLTGRTRQNKLVHFPAAPSLRPGTIAAVEIREAGLSSLGGELVDILAPPRRRARIPVVAV
jgi:tRNA-2-methylthio-N6-dimethylallyladenosine synthase